uniref:Uncharacterized protein n=1 Tax=Rhizophagus irregularis (strain DAOM 181602 / DAOM 197198 / MUCL 43194) TaxID=747089 RepID=U9UUV5_RHIID
MTDCTPSNSKKIRLQFMADTTAMEKHIISNCLKVDHLIREAIIYMVKAREHKISSGTNVKRQNNDQTILEDFYENSDSVRNEKKILIQHLLRHLYVVVYRGI